MIDTAEDSGLTANQLWGAAWILGLVAVGTCLRLGLYAQDGVPVQSEHFLWLAVCAIAVVLSACAAVLAGVKAAEARMRQLLQLPLP